MAVRKSERRASAGGLSAWIDPDEVRQIRAELDDLDTMRDVVEWVFALDGEPEVRAPFFELAYRIRLQRRLEDDTIYPGASANLADPVHDDLRHTLAAGTIVSTACWRRAKAIREYARSNGKRVRAALEHASRCPVCNGPSIAPKYGRRHGHLYCSDHLTEEALEVEALLSQEGT